MLFSILIPVRNDKGNLLRCLAALEGQDLENCEVLIGDNGSQPALTLDDLKGIQIEVHLFSLKAAGPAATRNFLARKARGQYLFFLDSDTLPLRETLACAREILSRNPGIQAFFGSYDDAPDHPSLVSVYKNLLHHYVHQRSAGPVSTFWCGCGLILRSLYLESGGLLESYQKPSIEDIELGMWLRRQGVTIHLFTQLQVKHLKQWTFWNWLYTDLFRRGIPWVRLMRSTRNWIGELNFSWKLRLSSLSALMFTGTLFAAPFWPGAILLSALALGGFLYLNSGFLQLVITKQGLARAGPLMLLHMMYALVCVLSLVIGIVTSFRAPEKRGAGLSPEAFFQ